MFGLAGLDAVLVDHYLAKEGVLALPSVLARIADLGGTVASLEMGVSESEAIPGRPLKPLHLVRSSLVVSEGRLGSYDGVGVVLDMLQTHVTSVLSLISRSPLFDGAHPHSQSSLHIEPGRLALEAAA